MCTKYIIKICLAFVFIFRMFYITSGQNNQVFEAETAILSGFAEIATCDNASNGQMVKGLDNGDANAVLFQNINVPQTGDYFVEISYFTVNERNLAYKINSGEEQAETVPASGAWCYQGGIPADFTFKVTFTEGDNNLLFYSSPIIDKITILTDTTSRKASALYISSSSGDDNNDGLTPETAFQTLSKVNELDLLPGDSLFFKSGDTFIGKLSILNEGGSAENPIIIASYGEGNQPVLDGDGYLSAINVVNSGYLHFSNLEIKNDGGPAKSGEPENLRYGMFVENTLTDGTFFEHYRLENLTFRNIYPTIEVTDDDNTGVNAHAIITSGSWGDEIHPTRFDDMLIENCLFTRTARHATYFKSVNNLTIKNNHFEHVGGAGMVIGNACTNILVERNTTNYTGSKIDSRMAGRGSGIWCFHSKNLTVQHNKFMHAHGIHDSYGMHIDIGNRNVVYQYNYSENNEGGFVEILGENVNVGYRYNLSVGDGWRKRGNRFGQIFWLAGWSGNPQNPIGSDSIFVYNNSIYVRDTIAPGIWIEDVSKNARIYNNIIQVANEFGPVVIKNNSSYNDFDSNIWSGNIPQTDEDDYSYRGINAIVANPLYRDEIVTDSLGFVLQEGSPAIGSGKLIYNADFAGPFDGFYSNGGRDYFGNEVFSTTQPNIGAYNGKIFSIVKELAVKTSFKLFPNPVKSGQHLKIEISSKIKVKDLNIHIIDLTGKSKIEKLFKQNQAIKLEIGKLLPGSYLVKLNTGDYCETQKLLVL